MHYLFVCARAVNECTSEKRGIVMDTYIYIYSKTIILFFPETISVQHRVRLIRGYMKVT